MHKYFTLALGFCLSLILSTSLLAQDMEGSADHPMFTRMPHYTISEYSKNFNAVDVMIGQDKTKSVEGTATAIVYSFNDEEGKHKAPSRLQVERNYQNAIARLGGKMLYSNADFSTFKVSKGGKDIWAMLSGWYPIGNGQEMGAYKLDVVEVEAMKQDITASDILAALNEKGFIALQINFETGKSAIQKESMAIVDQIAQMLKDNPAIKVSVEGHTDNVGQAAANKTLSQSRAKAVTTALTGKGIAATRLSSVGWGQEKPVADNRTEEGRAQNRRVEIVKK